MLKGINPLSQNSFSSRVGNKFSTGKPDRKKSLKTKKIVPGKYNDPVFPQEKKAPKKSTNLSKTKPLPEKTVFTVAEYVQGAIKHLNAELGSNKQINEIAAGLFESIGNIETLKKEDLASSNVEEWSENITENVIYEYMDDLSDFLTNELKKVLLKSMDKTLAGKQCDSFRIRIKNYIGFNFADKLFDKLKTKIIETKKK